MSSRQPNNIRRLPGAALRATILLVLGGLMGCGEAGTSPLAGKSYAEILQACRAQAVKNLLGHKGDGPIPAGSPNCGAFAEQSLKAIELCIGAAQGSDDHLSWEEIVGAPKNRTFTFQGCELQAVDPSGNLGEEVGNPREKVDLLKGTCNQGGKLQINCWEQAGSFGPNPHETARAITGIEFQ